MVDADSAFRRQLRDRLTGLVDTVAEAADGRAALAIALRERPGVIFLDQRLLDDGELLEAFAAEDGLGDCPVVVITDGDVAPEVLSHATVAIKRSELNAGVISTVLRRRSRPSTSHDGYRPGGRRQRRPSATCWSAG